MTRKRVVNVLSWTSLLAGVGAALLFLLPPLKTSSSTVILPSQTSGASFLLSQPARTGTRDIEDIQVGDRVWANNPQLDREITAMPEPDDSWQQVELLVQKEDGYRLDVTLLRPLEWLSERKATVGGAIPLDIPDMSVYGDARIVSIQPCPPLSAGPGSVVTGVYRHSTSNILEIGVDGLAEPIGTTRDHPFWSEDLQQYVPAESLRIGEHLRNDAGDVFSVTSLEFRTDREPVYNLEVHAENVYFVSDLGLLVHNYNGQRQRLTFQKSGLVYQVRTGFGGRIESTFARITKDQIGKGTHTNQASQDLAQALGHGVEYDDAGHLIGNLLGGPGSKGSKNIFPQHFSVNRGQFAQFESWIASQVQMDKNVFVRVVPKYRGNSTRPYEVVYQVRVDGKTLLVPFLNELP